MYAIWLSDKQKYTDRFWMPHITTALLISSDKLLHFHQNDSFTISTSLDCEQVGDSQIQNYVSGQPSQFCHFLAVFCPILQQIPSRGCSQPCQTPVEVSKRLAAKVVQSNNASKQNTTVRLMACAITQKQQKKPEMHCTEITKRKVFRLRRTNEIQD